MATETLKLDQEQIFKVIRDFWDRYKQRDILGKFWEASAQVLDNEYLQIIQANQSKSVINVPVNWHYQWLPFTFVNVPSPSVAHDHFFFAFTATGGETSVPLPGATDAQQVAVYLNGIYLTDSPDLLGIDYSFVESTQTVVFDDSLGVGDEVFISWHEIGDAIDRPHNNLFFEEQLTAPQSVWTDSAGDAFDPAGQGTYDSGSTTDPIEVYVNGLLQPASAYTETSDTVLTLSVTLAADDIMALRWRRANASADSHAHLRFTKIVSEVADFVDLPFIIDPSVREEFFFLNGILQVRGVDYTPFPTRLVLSTGGQFDPDDIIELEVFGAPFTCQCDIDSDIISIPILQNGIDESSSNPPTIMLREGIDYTIVTNSDGTKSILAQQVLDGVFWAPDVFANERVVENNFGKPINFIRTNTEPYRAACQGLWFAYWNGPSITVIEDSAKILLGLPFARTNTTVTSITENPDGSFTIILADGTENIVPIGLEPTVNVGDAVEDFASLSTGVEVIDAEIDPFWFQRIPNLGALLASFTFDGRQVFAPFDDGGSWDDGGTLDDFGTLTEIAARNRKLFDALRHFVFLVDVDGVALNQAIQIGQEAGNIASAVTDLIFFLDSIKPAYTRYLLFVEVLFEDQYQFPVTDEVTLDLALLTTESCNFDDGGFFDADGPANLFVATAGQTVFGLNPTFPYTVGGGDLKVFVDGLLKSTPGDYAETNSVTVTFAVPLTGGEQVVIYEDDSASVPFDFLCPRDEVTLLLA